MKLRIIITNKRYRVNKIAHLSINGVTCINVSVSQIYILRKHFKIIPIKTGVVNIYKIK